MLAMADEQKIRLISSPSLLISIGSKLWQWLLKLKAPAI